MSGCQLPLEWETLCVHASVSGQAHAPSFLIEHVHPEEARALDTLGSFDTQRRTELICRQNILYISDVFCCSGFQNVLLSRTQNKRKKSMAREIACLPERAPFHFHNETERRRNLPVDTGSEDDAESCPYFNFCFLGIPKPIECPKKTNHTQHNSSSCLHDPTQTTYMTNGI